MSTGTISPTVPKPRAVVGARVSVVKGQEKVSHLIQHEVGVGYANTRQMDIVGTFEDLDVSAIKFSPWERPEMAQWLAAIPPVPFDVLIFAKLDRAIRNARDLVKLIDWADEHGKNVIFVEDGIDLSTEMGRIFAMLAAVFAGIEAKRIIKRVQETHDYLSNKARKTTGKPPYGYITVDIVDENGKVVGKGLAVDWKDTAKTVKWMAEEYISGSSYYEIAVKLTAKKVPTNAARNYKGQGRKNTKTPEEMTWSATVVAKILTGHYIRGWKVYKNEIALDELGNQIRLAPPVLDPEKFPGLQDDLDRAIAERKQTRTKKYPANPLLGVMVCGECKSPGTKHTAAKTLADGSVSEYKYYLCTGAKSVVRGKRCGISMKAAEVEELVYGTFLERWGDDEVTRRVYHAGEDHTAELEQVRAAIARIQHERDTADDWDDEDEEVYETRMRFQRGRRKELKALPQRAAGWTEEPTGKTYMREWGNQTPAEKLKLMKDHGIRFELFKDKSWHLYRIEPEEKALTRNAGS